GWAYRRKKEHGQWSHAYVGWGKEISKAQEGERRLKSAFGKRVKECHPTRRNMKIWRVHSQELLDWLYRHCGRLAHGKRVPGWFLSLPQHHRKAVLDGWLYGDGCEVAYDRPKQRVGVSVSLPLIRGMQMIAHSLGYSTNVGHVKKAGYEKVACKKCRVRDSYHLTVMDRKSKYTHHIDGIDWYLIRRVRSKTCLAVPVYDLEVEDDHSFVAEGVIVHNSDHHNARDGSRRYTYRHMLGRPLHPANTGQLQWGEAYREAHRRIWAECIRVLRSGGVFVVNVKNHIRRGEIVRVSEWHAEELQRQGLRFIDKIMIQTPGMRNGANAGLRVPHEDVWVLKKP